MNAPIEVGLQINLGTPKCLHQTEPDWRLLRVRAQRPGVSSATNKYDEFPLPHGLTRRGLHRVWQEYHILDRELRRSLHPREPPHVRFGSEADIRIFVMSALPPKADIAEHGGNVRFAPKADIAPNIKPRRLMGLCLDQNLIARTVVAPAHPFGCVRYSV
jgi:hypothetical protein